MRRKKTEKYYTVGECKYCKKVFDTSDSFVIFADKSKAHHECYRVDAELEQKAKGVI